MSTFEELERLEQEADAARAAMYAEEPEPETKPESDKTVESAVIDEDVAGVGDEGIIAVEDEPVVEVKTADVVLKKDDDGVDYKQKFLVVDGKLRAEIPRLSNELAQWKEYAGNLQSRVTALEETAKAKPSTPAAEVIPDDDYEVEVFVADNPGAAKLINKMKAEHKAELASLRDEIKSVDGRTQEARAEDQRAAKLARFEKEMADAGVPEWRTIDTDPGFKERISQRPYDIKVLQEAASQYDAKVVSSYFLDYKNSLIPPDNGDMPPNKGDASQNKLDKFTAPPRSVGGGPPSKSGTQPALTRANYVKFMAQTTPTGRGKYVPSQWGGLTEVQMEARFDAAIAKNELM